MKDELLIRFIDGKATPEEIDAVVAYLSEHPDEAKEWMQMETAARMADSRPVAAVSDADAQSSVARIMKSEPHKSQQHATPRGKVVRLSWVIGAVTAVAASVAVVLTIILPSEIPQEQPPLVSEVVKDSIPVEVQSDTLIVEKIAPVAKEYVAEAEVISKPVQESSQEQVGHQDAKPETIPDGSPLTISRIEKSTASSKSVAGSVKMLRPAKSPYRVKVKNPEKDFVFEWQGENMTSVSLEVKDAQGNKLVADKVSPDTMVYAVKSGYLMDRGELTWTLVATFSDGTSATRTGIIELAGMN